MLWSFFYYIRNFVAIPYMVKKALRAKDAHSREGYMFLLIKFGN